MKSFVSRTTGYTLRYLEFQGSGTPLVMIHGLGCASSYEYPHVALAGPLRQRHTILIDLLGFGFSDQPADFGYGIADHARMVADFIADRAFPRIDLFGHSMGGAVAIEAAGLLGPVIGNLVLSEANLDTGGGPFSQRVAAWSEADYVLKAHAATIAEAVAVGNADWAATMRLSSPRAVHRAAQSLVDGADPSWRDRLYRHPARKAFIFGERSLPDPDSDVLASHGIHILVVREAGHSMGIENPPGLAEAIASATS